MSRIFLLAAFVSIFSIFCLAQEDKLRILPIELNSKVGYINSTGKIVIEPQYDYGWKFSEGFACVVVNGKTGFIDESGSYLIKPQFSSTYGCYTEFREGFAPVHINDVRKIKRNWIDKSKWGFVDTKGKVTFFPNVNYVSGFREGLAFFKKGNLTGYMDKNFNVVIKPKFKSAGNFNEGRARATDIDGSEYYIDKNGRKLFRNFDGCDFQNGTACFKVKGKWGYINWDGEIIIDAKFDQGNYFGENGLAAVKVGKKWGFINKSGEFVIKPQFDDAVEFNEGLASVEINGKRGFINESGTMVIAPQYDKWVYWFEKGISEVRVEGKTGYIDKSGKFVWNPTK
jgi:hypothetical protein